MPRMPASGPSAAAILPVAPPAAISTADDPARPVPPATPASDEPAPASVSDLLRVRAEKPATGSGSKSASARTETATAETTQAELAEMTRRVQADVENLAEALKEAEKSASP